MRPATLRPQIALSAKDKTIILYFSRFDTLKTKKARAIPSVGLHEENQVHFLFIPT